MIQALIPDDAGLQLPAGTLLPAPGRSPISDPKLQRMVQSLLAERFKLVLRRETKELPVYELTVAKVVPKLQHPENVPCVLRDPQNPRAPLKPGESYCVMRTHSSVADFAANIEHLFERPVIDKTGITWIFEFRLLFAFDVGLRAGPGTVPSDPSIPSIFTALQEQFGLKLESAKGPVQVLVIDSVQRPSEN